MRHPLKENGDPEHHQDARHDDVRPHDGVKLGVLHLHELAVIHGGALGGGVILKLAQNEKLADEDARNGADRIERLREIEPLRGRFRRAHRQHVGIGARLKDGQAARQNEQRGEEVPVLHRKAGRIKKKAAHDKKPEAKEHAALVREAPDKERRREREAEIGAEKRDLNPRSLEVRHAHDALESGKERVGHVHGQSPRGKARGEQTESQQGVRRDEAGFRRSRSRHGVIRG